MGRVGPKETLPVFPRESPRVVPFECPECGRIFMNIAKGLRHRAKEHGMRLTYGGD